MKRFVNVRLPVLAACMLALGVGVGYLFVYYGIELIWITAVLPVAAVVVFVFTLLRKVRYIIFTLILTAFLVCGALNCFMRLENFAKSDIDCSVPYLITGTVKEKGKTRHGEYIILDGAAANGKPLSGKIRVNLSEIYGDFCDEGYEVTFLGSLIKNDAFPYGKLNYYAEDNIKYVCRSHEEIKSVYRFSFFGYIKSSVNDVLYDNLDYDTASICKAMLLGNTQNVDEDALDVFRYGGIAHIFAVSGLHIGLIFGIIRFICKHLRANKYVSAVVSVGLIILYAGVCGFTLSSVRALIMCAVTALTGLLHVKKDNLNNLAFSVVIILSYSPLSLFSVGFQLSVGAVGGIFILSKGFERAMRRIKTPRSVASAVGASFAAQAGTLPVMMKSFGYLSGAGLLLNLLIIPVISYLFKFMFIGTVISVLIPPLAQYIIPVCVLPLEAVLSFLLSANFENALISGFGAGLFLPLYYITILFISDKLNIKLISRGIAASIFTGLMIAYVVLKSGNPAGGALVHVNAAGDYGGSVIFKCPQGNVLVMTESAYTDGVIDSLNENYSLNPDGVIILGDDDCVMSYDTKLNAENVYVCALYIPVQPYSQITVHYERYFSLCGIDFEFVDGYTLKADVDGADVYVCAGETIPVKKCDMLISLYNNYDKETETVQCRARTEVYFTIRNKRLNCYDYGQLNFHIQGGEIKRYGLLPNTK